MHSQVLHKCAQSLSRLATRYSFAGDDVLGRIRTTGFAILGATAAIGLGFVILFAHQGWPVLQLGPVPAGPGHQAVGDASAVAPGAIAALTEPQSPGVAAPPVFPASTPAPPRSAAPQLSAGQLVAGSPPAGAEQPGTPAPQGPEPAPPEPGPAPEPVPVATPPAPAAVPPRTSEAPPSKEPGKGTDGEDSKGEDGGAESPSGGGRHHEHSKGGGSGGEGPSGDGRHHEHSKGGGSGGEGHHSGHDHGSSGTGKSPASPTELPATGSEEEAKTAPPESHGGKHGDGHGHGRDH